MALSLQNAGEVVARERRRQGLTLEALAKRAETTHSYIVRLEQNTVDPRFSTLKRVLAGLGMVLIAVDADLEPRIAELTSGDEEYLVNLNPGEE